MNEVNIFNIGSASLVFNVHNRRPASILLESTKSSMCSENVISLPVIAAMVFFCFVFFNQFAWLCLICSSFNIFAIPRAHPFELTFIELHEVIISPFVYCIKVLLQQLRVFLGFYFCTYFCVVREQSTYTNLQIIVYVRNHYDEEKGCQNYLVVQPKLHCVCLTWRHLPQHSISYYIESFLSILLISLLFCVLIFF